MGSLRREGEVGEDFEIWFLLDERFPAQSYPDRGCSDVSMEQRKHFVIRCLKPPRRRRFGELQVLALSLGIFLGSKYRPLSFSQPRRQTHNRRSDHLLLLGGRCISCRSSRMRSTLFKTVITRVPRAATMTW